MIGLSSQNWHNSNVTGFDTSVSSRYGVVTVWRFVDVQAFRYAYPISMRSYIQRYYVSVSVIPRVSLGHSALAPYLLSMCESCAVPACLHTGPEPSDSIVLFLDDYAPRRKCKADSVFILVLRASCRDNSSHSFVFSHRIGLLSLPGQERREKYPLRSRPASRLFLTSFFYR